MRRISMKDLMLSLSDKRNFIKTQDGRFRMDLDSGVYYDNETMIGRLGLRELHVFSLLLAHQGNLVSRESILTIVWGDRVVTETVVTVAISKIRTLLKKICGNGDYIITVSGCGYIFNAEKTGMVVVEESPPPQK